MKRFICVLLSFIIITIPVISYSCVPVKAESEFFAKVMVEDVGLLVKKCFQNIAKGAEYTNDYLAKPWENLRDTLTESTNEDGSITTTDPDAPVHIDGDYVVITKKALDDMNQVAQDEVYRLDGYYLLESCGSSTNILRNTTPVINVMNSYPGVGFTAENNISQNDIIRSTSTHVYILKDVSGCAYLNNSGTITKSSGNSNCTGFSVKASSSVIKLSTYTYSGCVSFTPSEYGKSIFYSGSAPLKLFYTETDYKNYINQGRTYAPFIPATNDLRIPVQNFNSTTIQNTFNNISPDLNVNMTELEIQNAIDLAIKNALDDLTINTDVPTPTTAPSDIPIITPIPTITPGNSETDSWLEKIHTAITTFFKGHSEFEKSVNEYLKGNGEKLDLIIKAFDSLDTGGTATVNGCKYDLTELSNYLKTLWNDSDKKFDSMIALLETNNNYQKEICKSLDEIKALLVVDTVLDLFTNRSKETADKAKEKFPTSLPWDVALVVNAMCAPPETPIIKIPMEIPSLNIKEELVIDLSGDVWTKLAKTCRGMLSILFVLYLIHLTRELIKGGDD